MEDPKYPGTELAPRFEDQEVTVTQPVHVGYYSRVDGRQYDLDGDEIVAEAPAAVKKPKPAKVKGSEGEQA